MALNRKEGKLFWKSLNKLDNKKSNETFTSTISPESWINQFKETLISSKEPIYPTNSVEQGPLDQDIILEELKEAAYVLKNGKACGIDKIPNEMSKCILEKKPGILMKILNSILRYKGTNAVWDFSILTPIHKEGSKMDTGNYRGIIEE